MSRHSGTEINEPKLLPALVRRPRAIGKRFHYYPSALTKIDELEKGQEIYVSSIPTDNRDLTVEVRDSADNKYRIMWRDLRL